MKEEISSLRFRLSSIGCGKAIELLETTRCQENIKRTAALKEHRGRRAARPDEHAQVLLTLASPVAAILYTRRLPQSSNRGPNPMAEECKLCVHHFQILLQCQDFLLSQQARHVTSHQPPA